MNVDNPTEGQWHMHPDLHAECVARADELAEHFLDVRLTADVPEWLAQRQAAAEEGWSR